MSITLSDIFDSELIQTIKYDDEKQTLVVYFHKTKSITYLNVPQEIWTDFLEAEDPDEFYTIFVKDEFDTQEEYDYSGNMIL
jgi:hypothetical protein